MAKKKKEGKSYLLIVLIILAVIFLALFKYTYTNTKNSAQSSKVTPSPLLMDAAVWYPSAAWTSPIKSSFATSYGFLQGQSITAQVISDEAFLDHFEIVSELNKDGFTPDNMLSADSAGSSQWGYKKTSDGMSEILIFSYKTKPTNSSTNGPLEFNCPCKIDIEVFASKPFRIAN